MAENNDFTHLPLPLLFQGKPKLHGGGAASDQTKRNIANRIAHGGYVRRRSAVTFLEGTSCRTFRKCLARNRNGHSYTARDRPFC